MKPKNDYILKNEELAKKYSEFVEKGLSGYKEINSTYVEYDKIYSINGKHTFFGYYDLPQINSNGTKMLILVVDKNACPKYDKADVYYINLLDDSYHYICSTHAWCWQQGCRMRWSSVEENQIFLNNVQNNQYVTEVWNIEKMEKINQFPVAFYDIAFKKRIGLGLNFSRLQSMRPGYGYSSLNDDTYNEIAPIEGIYSYNFDENIKKNIISLKELAQKVNAPNDCFHYINHICISPDEKKFSFFHLWATDNISMWNMNLMIADINGSNIKVIETQKIVSHYCWINENEIMVTLILQENEKCFVIYNVSNGNKRTIQNNDLIHDGHPVMLPDNIHFIADTYPLENCIQTLFISSILPNEPIKILMKVFSDPRLYIEKRCDLHPRFFQKDNIITIDSTFSDGIRKIIFIKLKKSFL